MKCSHDVDRLTQTDNKFATPSSTQYRRQHTYPPLAASSRAESGRLRVPVSCKPREEFVGGHLSEAFSRISVRRRLDDEIVISGRSISGVASAYAGSLYQVAHTSTEQETAAASLQADTRSSNGWQYLQQPKRQTIPYQNQAKPIPMKLKKHRKQKTDMSDCKNRFRTYYEYQPSWQRRAIDIMILSSHGLYYTGIEDRCECFECHISIEKWSSSDNSLKRHFQESPNCLFLRWNFLKEIETICTIEFSSYATVQSRKTSFSTWPIPRQISGHLLAENGWFYTGRDVTTQCFTCGCLSDRWQTGDNPLLIHMNRCKDCTFLRKQQQEAAAEEIESKSLDFSTRDARLVSYSNLPFKDLWIDTEEFANAGFFLVKSSPMLTVQCYSCRLVVSDWSPGDDPYTKHLKMKPDCLFFTENPSSQSQLTASTTGVYSIKSLSDIPSGSTTSSNTLLSSLVDYEKDDNYCVVCLHNMKQYAIVPCGHLCVCSECSVLLKQCPLCRCAKKAVLRIYSS